MAECPDGTVSSWMATAPVQSRGALTEDIRADVCIVGAGIAGMTTAYLLAREGKSVVVLDDGPIGGGETGRTTAHLTFALDDRFYELERLHGESGARLAAESHRAAVNRIESIVNEERIECDFERVDGYLFALPGHPADDLDRELAAVHRVGLRDVEMVKRAPIDSFDTGRCLRFPRQGQFHPLKYLAGLADAIVRRGGRICTNTPVTGITGGEGAYAETSTGKRVTADAIVVATNSPINDRVVIHTKQAPYRTYVIGVRVPRGVLPHILLWDTADPYHYIRLQDLPSSYADNAGNDELLIVGGEDHKTGQDADPVAHLDCLESWMRERFPMAGEILFKWSGQVMEPFDGLAYIGRNPLDDDNVYIITGDSGQGMTHCTIGGMLITDLIMDRENPWTDLYDPGRVNLKAGGEFVREGANVAAQYAEWLTGGDAGSEDEIQPGCGALLRDGLTKIAVYRDPEGVLHRYSAVCPHAGCIVEWNDLEKSWDCPCHGSRFDPCGNVLNGPAFGGLPEVES